MNLDLAYCTVFGLILLDIPSIFTQTWTWHIVLFLDLFFWTSLLYLIKLGLGILYCFWTYSSGHPFYIYSNLDLAYCTVFGLILLDFPSIFNQTWTWHIVLFLDLFFWTSLLYLLKLGLGILYCFWTYSSGLPSYIKLAKLKDDYLHHFDENINGLFNFYYFSPVRRKELKDVAAEIEIEFKQFGLLKNIRWLASRSRSLSILEQNYLAIIYDLESK